MMNWNFISKSAQIVLFLLIFIFSFSFTITAQDEAPIEYDSTMTSEGVFVGIVEDRVFENTTAGEFTPGKGFTIFETGLASLNISVYGLARYINQMPGNQEFKDHLGRPRIADTRNDIWWHRSMAWFSGFFYSPKLRYTLTVWGLTATNQVLLFGNIQYSVHKAATLGIGIMPNLGTRSMQGPWPFFLSSDRLMAEEFFRPGFTMGAWITGEPLPKFRYWAMVGNNLSQLGVTASQMNRDLSTSGSVWWMPTTGEFGPRGGSGDFEIHEELATRFGFSLVHCREDRQSQVGSPSAETQVKISDGVLFYDTGALADNVTVLEADFDQGAIDAGIKINGWHLQVEYYFRNLSKFDAQGPEPELSSIPTSIFDHGFYAFASYEIIPKALQIYGATSWIYDDFRREPWEIAAGMNWYPAGTRSFRLNLHAIYVDQSPASSSFGFYINGQTGTTISTGVDFLL
ncbi:MAG: hypothetical protein ACM339_12055 [Ignavibacteria bacterium]